MLRINTLPITLIMLGLTLSTQVQNTSGAPETPQHTMGQPLSLKTAGTLITENLLARDHMWYNDEALHYSEACAAVGALRFVTLTQDQHTQDRLVARYEKLLDNNNPLISRRPHVDMNVIGIIPLQVYLLTRDKRYLDQGLTFADSQWDNPQADGLTSQTRWWIDDMYMVGMLQMQAYRATQDIKYADRGARQIHAYLKKLQQKNGLFYHAPGCPFFWGRGNGWVAASLAEVLAALPSDHSLQPDILKHYQKMMQALLTYQSDNGMWRQLVDYPYSWAESSGTAMFAYAMAVGLNHNWLEQDAYKPAVEKAWAALAGNIDSEGNLLEICIGTDKQNNLEYYMKRPRHAGDFHGQAPVLWLIVEMLSGPVFNVP